MAGGRGKRRAKGKDKRGRPLSALLVPIGSTCEHPCPDCGASMTLRKGAYGLFYSCTRYPHCKTAHGAHDQTGKPLGVPANAETRAARIRAHDQFDKLWRGDSSRMTRNEAYGWLARKLGISRKDCHIGMFDMSQCDRVVAVCQEPAQQ